MLTTGTNAYDFAIVVPDTAAPGPVQLELSAVFERESFRTRHTQTIVVSAAPRAITMSSLTVESDRVRLAWTNGPEFSDWSVERRDGSGAWLVRPATAVTPDSVVFEDRNVDPESLYVYRLRYRLGLGVRTTGEVRVTIPLPPPPELLSAVAEPTRVRLAWTRIPAASDIRVQRREAESVWRDMGSATLVSDMLVYEDTTVTAGSEYRYRLQYAVGARTLYGAEDSVMVPLVTLIQSSGAFTLDDRVRVQWKMASSPDEASVERRTDAVGWIAIGAPRDSSATLILEDRTVASDKSYAYRLRYRMGGWSYLSDELAVHTPLPPVAGIESVVIRRDRVRIVWRVPAGWMDAVVSAARAGFGLGSRGNPAGQLRNTFVRGPRRLRRSRLRLPARVHDRRASVRE